MKEGTEFIRVNNKTFSKLLGERFDRLYYRHVNHYPGYDDEHICRKVESMLDHKQKELYDLKHEMKK